MQSTQPKLADKPSFWRAAYGEFWVRFGSTWFVVGAIFLAVGLALLAGEWRYRSDGVTSPALVTSKDFSLNHGGTPEENQRIKDALSGLSVLRREVVAWNSKTAS